MVFGPTFLCLHCLKCQSASRGHNLPYQLPMATGAKTCMAFGHIFSSWILHLGRECNQLESLLTLMGFAPTEFTLPKFKDLRVRLLELLAILLHSCDQVMDHPNIRDPPRHPNKVTRHLWHLVPLAHPGSIWYPASRTGRSDTNLVPLRSIAVSLRNMEPTYLAVPLGMKNYGLLNFHMETSREHLKFWWGYGITKGGVMANPFSTCGMYLILLRRETMTLCREALLWTSFCHKYWDPILAPLHCILVPVSSKTLPHCHRKVMILGDSWMTAGFYPMQYWYLKKSETLQTPQKNGMYQTCYPSEV